MLEKIFKKQEKVQDKVQEKIQKQQELNDKDCRELTDEELEQVVGGVTAAQLAQVAQRTVAQGAYDPTVQVRRRMKQLGL